MFNDGLYRLTGHAQQRQWERNADLWDIGSVLMTGEMKTDPAWNERTREWRYRICGHDREGIELAVVIAFEGRLERLVVITCTGW